MDDYLRELIDRQRRKEQTDRISGGLRSIGATLMGKPYSGGSSSERGIEDTIALEQVKSQMEEERRRRNLEAMGPMLQQGGFRVKSISSSGEPSFEREESLEDIAAKEAQKLRVTQAMEDIKTKSSMEKQQEKDTREGELFMQGLVNQFKTIQNAFPAKAKSATGQRWLGFLGKAGAVTGLGTGPEQTAFAKTQKMKARSLIKKFEGGRLTDQDIEQAANAMVDFGLTEDERKAVVYDLATQIAVDKGVDPQTVNDYLEQEIGKIGGSDKAGGKVKMRDPQGNMFTVDSSEVEEALQNGWTR